MRYDEPDTLPYSIRPFCPMSADGGQGVRFWLLSVHEPVKRCHDLTTRMVETRGFRRDIELDGWPLDSNHPVYRTR